MNITLLLVILLSIHTAHSMLDIDSMTEEEIVQKFSRCCHSCLNRFTLEQYAVLQKIFGKDCLKESSTTFLCFSETLLVSKKDTNYCIRRLVLKELALKDKKQCARISKSEKISQHAIIETINDIYKIFPEGAYFSDKGETKVYTYGLERYHLDVKHLPTCKKE